MCDIEERKIIGIYQKLVIKEADAHVRVLDACIPNKITAEKTVDARKLAGQRDSSR